MYALYRFLKIKLLNDKTPFACSLAPTIKCNLKCAGCYERVNRMESAKELSKEQFAILVDKLWKMRIKHCTLTDGEPLLNENSIEKCEIAINKFWMTWLVTNGTHEFPDFKVLYIVSLDGNKEIHNKLRGSGIYEKMKKNVKESPNDLVFATCTLNKVNHKYIDKIVGSAIDLGVLGIVFNWYTPFSNSDPLWVSYPERNDDIDIILKLKERFPEFIWNSKEELEIMRNSEWTKRCPRWCTISIDAFGKKKEPCVLGSQAICEKCGCHVFPSVLITLENFRKGMLLKGVETYWSKYH